MLTLKDIKEDEKMRANILQDLTPWENISDDVISHINEVSHMDIMHPERIDLERMVSELEALVEYYFIIDVHDCQAFLCLMRKDKKIGIVEEIPRKLLLKAIKGEGGAINMSGQYPIDDKVREWLKNQLQKEVQ